MKRGSKVIEILMARDGLSRDEASRAFQSARSEVCDALMGTSCLDPEEVLEQELGLEPDYLFEFL